MKWNLKRKSAAVADTVNLAGGEAFSQTDKLELASILLTSTLKDQFYRNGDATAARLRVLVGQMADKAFVAKAALYARKEAGMRSGSHLIAAEVAKGVKGAAWTRRFFVRVVHRPDDVLEILACYIGSYGRPIPNALKKGLGEALTRFDAYQLAKYRKESAEFSLVDAVNLVHPPHTEPLRALVRGELAAAKTWETQLTQAGQKAESAEELAEMKRDAWSELIATRKLGYFALLRNLRNILTQAPEAVGAALEMLVDEKLIRSSLVLPFRFMTALEAVQSAGLPDASSVLSALSVAVDKSLANVPEFPGRTLIVLDGSGSMMGRPIKIGALFTAVLAKANRADVMLFSDDAKYISLDVRDSTLTLAKWLESQCASAGTNFHAPFLKASRAYDRIIILSDMQGWVGGHAPTSAFAAYKKRTGADPRVFSFDLQGYGTMQFPERNVCALAGWSDKSLELLKTLDGDPRALIKRIEAVSL